MASGRDFVLSKRVACPRIAGVLRVILGGHMEYFRHIGIVREVILAISVSIVWSQLQAKLGAK